MVSTAITVLPKVEVANYSNEGGIMAESNEATITVSTFFSDEVQVTRKEFTDRWVRSVKDIGFYRIMAHGYGTDMYDADKKKLEDFEIWVEDMAGREFDHLLTNRQENQS